MITTLWQEVRLTGKAIVAAEASSAQKVKLNGRLFAVQNGCFLAGFGIAAVLFLYRDWFHAAMVIELGLLILGTLQPRTHFTGARVAALYPRPSVGIVSESPIFFRYAETVMAHAAGPMGPYLGVAR
ncbi:hypothetical protein [Sulfobacillus thermosulfidooxidans]|uniref:hypothetical protein n=1 Tax=Sulfobacillus thermosulfidooxidans TaxID=28034 RepID=UPI0002FEF4C1|nr:hypothetical protein [Sulfobacillus thermosulfidooxidans]